MSQVIQQLERRWRKLEREVSAIKKRLSIHVMNRGGGEPGACSRETKSLPRSCAWADISEKPKERGAKCSSSWTRTNYQFCKKRMIAYDVCSPTDQYPKDEVAVT